MKKRMLSILIVAAISVSLLLGCGTEASQSTASETQTVEQSSTSNSDESTDETVSINENDTENNEEKPVLAYKRKKKKSSSANVYLILNFSDNSVNQFSENNTDVRTGTFTGTFDEGIIITYDDGAQFSVSGSENSIKYKLVDSSRDDEQVYNKDSLISANGVLDEILRKQDVINNYEYNLSKHFDIVEFGTYEDRPIKWLVLITDGERSLLMSTYILEFLKYNDPDMVETDIKIAWWGNSYVREWLNDDFYYTAFTDAERQEIEPTSHDASGENGEEDFEDNVFLFTKDDVEYFLERNEMDARPVDGKGALGAGGKDGFYPWLTSTAKSGAEWVTVSGSHDSTVRYNEYVGIRPVITVYNEAIE